MIRCGDSGGRKADGKPCGSTLGFSAAGLCIMHDPHRVAELRAMRAGELEAPIGRA